MSPYSTRRLPPRSIELCIINKQFLNIFFENDYFQATTIIAVFAVLYRESETRSIIFIHIRHPSIEYNTYFALIDKFIFIDFFRTIQWLLLFTHISLSCTLFSLKGNRTKYMRATMLLSYLFSTLNRQ